MLELSHRRDRLTCNLDLAGPLGGPVQDDLLGGLQVGEVCPGLHVKDGPAMGTFVQELTTGRRRVHSGQHRDNSQVDNTQYGTDSFSQQNAPLILTLADHLLVPSNK